MTEMTDLEAKLICDAVLHNVDQHLDARIAADRSFLGHVFRTSLTCVGAVIFLAGGVAAFFGYQTIQDIAARAQKAVEQSIEENQQRARKSLQEFFEKEATLTFRSQAERHYDETLVLLRRAMLLDDSQIQYQPLSEADGVRLANILCAPTSQDALFLSTVALLPTLAREPWWPKQTSRFAWVATASPPCSISPDRQARIIDALSSSRSKEIYHAVRDLFELPTTNDDIKSAILTFGRQLGTRDLVPAAERLAGDPGPLVGPALKVIASWSPNSTALVGWIDKLNTAAPDPDVVRLITELIDSSRSWVVEEGTQVQEHQALQLALIDKLLRMRIALGSARMNRGEITNVTLIVPRGNGGGVPIGEIPVGLFLLPQPVISAVFEPLAKGPFEGFASGVKMFSSYESGLALAATLTDSTRIATQRSGLLSGRSLQGPLYLSGSSSQFRKSISAAWYDQKLQAFRQDEVLGIQNASGLRFSLSASPDYGPGFGSDSGFWR